MKLIAKNEVLAPVIYRKNNAQPASIPGIRAFSIFFLLLTIASRRAVIHIHTDMRNIAYTLGFADKAEYRIPAEYGRNRKQNTVAPANANSIARPKRPQNLSLISPE